MSQPDKRWAGRRARAEPGLAELGRAAVSSRDPRAGEASGFLETEGAPSVAGAETVESPEVGLSVVLLVVPEEDLPRPECGGPEGRAGLLASGPQEMEGEGGGGAEGLIDSSPGGRDPWRGLAPAGRGDDAWFVGRVCAAGREGEGEDEGGGGGRPLVC